MNPFYKIDIRSERALLIWTWLERAILIASIIPGQYIKWKAGFLDGWEDWHSFLSSLMTIVIVGLMLSCRRPTHVHLDPKVVLGVFFCILPSYCAPYLVKAPGLVIDTLIGCRLYLNVIILMCYLTIRRNFGLFPSMREIVTTGPYALVRHPIYACHIHIQLMFLLAAFSSWHMFLLAGVIGGVIIRIIEEEEILSESPVYVAYKARVRPRLFHPVFLIPFLAVAAAMLHAAFREA